MSVSLVMDEQVMSASKMCVPLTIPFGSAARPWLALLAGSLTHYVLCILSQVLSPTCY